MWQSLPDMILEDIFSMLSIQDRCSASLTCTSWCDIFYSPRIWHRFILPDFLLTRRKFNYYMGYEHVIDHYRTQICLHKVGRHFRILVFKPTSNFFNLYEFIKTLTNFAECKNEPLRNVRALHFSFACHLDDVGDQDYVFGTGGKLLEGLKNLMSCLYGLKDLSLNDLLLDIHEAMYLLDSIAQNCCETLTKLQVINCSKIHYPLLPVGVFLNLTTLRISPQHLNDDIVVLLGNTRLRNMYIIQTVYTDNTKPVSSEAWRECSRLSPKLSVHLIIDGPTKNLEVVWQCKAPVKSIIYNSPYIPISYQSILSVCEYYKGLSTYGHFSLPRFHNPKCFHERGDSALVLLCRRCPSLENLIVREKISTATVLLIAHSSVNLTRLYVRKNAVIKKCDWPHNPEWTDEFYVWLKKNSMSYDDTSREVSHLMGYQWEMLSDKMFKTISKYYV